MKKLLTVCIGAGLAFGAAFPVNALTVDESIKKIQELTAQIKALQEQMANLRKQQAEVHVSANQAVIEIAASLREGSEGDQVKVLQTLLSLDSSLYPEGRITGFFGPATRRAIERFQRSHGLEAVGFVGPRTRAELNKFIREQFKAVENLEDDLDDDVAEEIKRAIANVTLPPLPSDPCAIPGLPTSSSTPWVQKEGKVKIVQTGNVFIYKDGKHKIIITPNTYHEKDGKRQLLITPGMRIEKDGKFKSIIPCNGSTTTPPTPGADTTPPAISDVNAAAAQTSAAITWKTDEPAAGKVFFSTTSPVTTSSPSVSESNWWWFGNFGTNHSVNVSGLTASTTYYFVVESKDKKGNMATSTERSFKTSTVADTVAPVITAVSVSGIGTSTATVTWTTNENANSKIYYGTSTPIATSTASTKTDGTLVTLHSLTLTGLTPNAAHYFKVESADASGNISLSSEASFATLALPPVDATAPAISAVAVNAASTSAAVTWTTNETATSKAYYGTSTPLSLGSALSVSGAGLMTSHALNLTSLTASTTYYIIVESKDAANNTATSSKSSFVTGS